MKKIKIVLSILSILIICVCVAGAIFIRLCFIKYDNIHYLQNSEGNWIEYERSLPKDFYRTKEARRIGDNLIFFQSPEGGWAKDIRMQEKLSKFDKFMLKNFKKEYWQATIDNDATSTEIDFLTKLYKTQKERAYKLSIKRGLTYILRLQYSNGGFPQFAPERIDQSSYHYQITFNDNAIINVMTILQKIIYKDKFYKFSNPFLQQEVKYAYDKGLDLILKTQLPSGMWAAQYDKVTLKPCYARAFEPPAIDTRESASIVRFLMSIEKPSKAIINSVEKSVAWYKKNAIKNKEQTTVIDNGHTHITLKDCADCAPIWARFYDLDKGIPIFSDRSKHIKYNAQEISEDRALSYEWYTTAGNDVLEAYDKWIKKVKK